MVLVQGDSHEPDERKRNTAEGSGGGLKGSFSSSSAEEKRETLAHGGEETKQREKSFSRPIDRKRTNQRVHCGGDFRKERGKKKNRDRKIQKKGTFTVSS